jgi:hypothetical protein
VDEGGGSGGKGVDEGREWKERRRGKEVVGSEWRMGGESGDAGPSLPFVIGARCCLGWCWAAVAVRRWCM